MGGFEEFIYALADTTLWFKTKTILSGIETY